LDPVLNQFTEVDEVTTFSLLLINMQYSRYILIQAQLLKNIWTLIESSIEFDEIKFLKGRVF